MSTNINISVGDNKLLEQARQQQAASRQAQLEKEANQRLEAQATDARTSALAAQGKDANGNPLTGTRFQTPRVERRPAASRAGEGPVTLTPKRDPIGTQPLPNLLLSAEGNQASKLPNALRFVENSVNWFVTLASPPDDYPGFLVDFAPVAGKKSILPYFNMQIETTGIKKPITITEEGGYTYEFWVYLESLSQSIKDLGLLVSIPGQGITAANYVTVAINETGAYFAQLTWLGYVDGTNNLTLYSAAEGRLNIPMAPKTWAHVCVMADSNFIRYYVNGQLDGQIGRFSSEGQDYTPAFGPYSNVALFLQNGDNTNAVHGIKYTPKLKYPLGGFTPDPNL